MAKRGKKAARKARPARRKIKSFRMATIKKLFVRLQKRRRVADAVVAALQRGGKAVETPQFPGGLSDLEKANRVADNLGKAVVALAQTCPNDLASHFKIDIGSRRAAPKRPRR